MAELEAMASEEQSAVYAKFAEAERSRRAEAKRLVEKLDAEGREATVRQRFESEFRSLSVEEFEQ